MRIWGLATGTALGDPLTGHTLPVVAVACTQFNGQPIAVTGSRDATVRIWDLQTRRQIDRIELPSGAAALDVTATGQIIAAFAGTSPS